MTLITPDWPAPARVRAAVTTRTGGVSTGGYASLNLASHVGDDPAAVAENRARLQKLLGDAPPVQWLTQVHGCGVVDALPDGVTREGDASLTDQPGVVCGVLTADCLPVLFCDRAGTRVAAAHAGWRGLAGGVLEATLARLAVPPGEVLAWLGPAIGPHHFEVGPEVREAFLGGPGAREALQAAFRPGQGDRWMADIFALARARLAAVGVDAVYGGGLCTVSDAARFYSFRREPESGRFASLIWLQPA